MVGPDRFEDRVVGHRAPGGIVEVETQQALLARLRRIEGRARRARAAGSHAQALTPEFIHRFGIAGPLDEARTRLRQIGDLGIDFVRIIPGSRDAPGEVTLPSIAALSTLVEEFAS